MTYFERLTEKKRKQIEGGRKERGKNKKRNRKINKYFEFKSQIE